MDNVNFGELIKFPSKIVFKFIGSNQRELEENVKSFFVKELKVSPKISQGRVSSNGKYLTLNVKVEVANEETMKRIYTDGAKVPLVVHVL